MRLIKILTALIAFHIGSGFTQVAVSYFAGDVADHGAAGWVSHTPIGTFVTIASGEPEDTNVEDEPTGPLDFANKLGDMINGLASFNYGFLAAIQPEAGLVYMVVVGFRIMTTLITLGVAMALLYVLFDSGLLKSVTGQIAAGLAVAGTGIISGIGALFG